MITPPTRSTVTDLRHAAALAVALPHLLVELDLDGRGSVRVSHDPAFRPMVPPCALRKAIIGPQPDWLALTTRVTLHGPFVEIDHHAGTDIALWESGASRSARFVASVPSEDLVARVRACDPPGIDTALIDGRISVDDELGLAVVAIFSDAYPTETLRDVARWLAPQLRWARPPATRRRTPRSAGTST